MPDLKAKSAAQKLLEKIEKVAVSDPQEQQLCFVKREQEGGDVLWVKVAGGSEWTPIPVKLLGPLKYVQTIRQENEILHVVRLTWRRPRSEETRRYATRLRPPEGESSPVDADAPEMRATVALRDSAGGGRVGGRNTARRNARTAARLCGYVYDSKINDYVWHCWG